MNEVTSVTCAEVRYKSLLPLVFSFEYFSGPFRSCIDILVEMFDSNNLKVYSHIEQQHHWFGQLDYHTQPLLHSDMTVVELSKEAVVVHQRYLQRH